MITDVPGVRVGHWTDADALTGCTVIVPPPNTGGGVWVPGGAPATRGTDGLAPGTSSGEVHAIVLTGGSAFGLGVADGVMAALEEIGVGLPLPAGPVPIVPAAAIYDLGIGRADVRPGPAAGRAAFEAASEAERSEGNVGAGTGATVGKTAGPENISKGGLGSSSVRVGDLVVGALVVVNAIGDVVDDDGSVIAGARGPAIELPPIQYGGPPPPGATTLACIATNAWLSKEHCRRVAIMASGGLARAVRPVFSMFDGDTVFVLATRGTTSPVELVGRLAADVLAEAVRRGVRAAESVPGAPAMGTRA